MSFPEIEDCLICDAIREEARGKLTILGFLGLCPSADFSVQDFGRLFPLAFLFVGGPGDGTFQISFEVIDETDGRVIAKGAGGTPPISPVRRTWLAAQMPLTFPRAGGYAIRLLADGEERFVGRFRVSLAAPEQQVG